MKLTRLLLVLALLLSVLTVPDVFAGKSKHGGILKHSHGAKALANACEWYDVYCDGVTYSDSCCGSLGSCLAYCDETCGVSPGTCQPM